MDVVLNYQRKHFLQCDNVVIIYLLQKIFKTFVFVVVGVIANKRRA